MPRAFLTSTFERETPEAIAFRARAESLPFATLLPVRNDPTARLRAAAQALGVPAPVLAERLAGCPDCRAFVVWGEVRGA